MSATKKFFKAPRYLLRKFNILHTVRGLPVTSFIDVGCGAGELACSLAESGYKGVGIDFSDEAIAYAETIKLERNIPDSQLNFYQGSLNVIPKKADLVICCEVIEHLEDDDAFLRDVKKYGTYFLFSVPARMKWFDEFDEKVGHYRRYEKDELVDQLTRHGYEVQNFMSYGFPIINATRLIRKVLAKKVKHHDSIENKTKHSGVNPIKSSTLETLDIEAAMKPLYWLSRPFNGFNLSEGYLVLCLVKK